MTAGKTLPLQIHPSKELACVFEPILPRRLWLILAHSEQLRPQYPEDLPDSNHKPEVGLALTEFEAFAAFRPYETIQASIKAIPELRQALGPVADEIIKGPGSEELLRKGCSAILNRRLHESSYMESLVKGLSARCKQQGDEAVAHISVPENKGLAEIFVRIDHVRFNDAFMVGWTSETNLVAGIRRRLRKLRLLLLYEPFPSESRRVHLCSRQHRACLDKRNLLRVYHFLRSQIVMADLMCTIFQIDGM